MEKGYNYTNDGTVRYLIRRTKIEEINKLRNLIIVGGFDYSLEHLCQWYNLKDSISLVAVTANNELISHCGFVSLDENLSFIGLYITHPNYRHKGIGTKLFTECLCLIPKGHAIGLHGASHLSNVYQSLGFTRLLFKTNIFLGIVDKSFQRKKQSTDYDGENKSLKISNLNKMNELVEYDRHLCSLNREKFIETWVAFMEFVLVAHEKNHIVGYACVRKGIQGYYVTPLYADSSVIADSLINSVLNHLEERSQVYFYTPDYNQEAVKILIENNFQVKGFAELRIADEYKYSFSREKVFSLSCFESMLT